MATIPHWCTYAMATIPHWCTYAVATIATQAASIGLNAALWTGDLFCQIDSPSKGKVLLQSALSVVNVTAHRPLDEALEPFDICVLYGAWL